MTKNECLEEALKLIIQLDLTQSPLGIRKTINLIYAIKEAINNCDNCDNCECKNIKIL